MITVKLFALLKDKAGRSELPITFRGGTVADLLRQVSHEYPALADVLSCGGIIVSVNHEFVKSDAVVKDGDEVALMPPFSGGSGAVPTVRIQHEPFSVEQEIAKLKTTSTAIGAIVMFLGTTRDISMDKQVAKLEFEHYPGMAEKMLSEIRDRAIKEYGVIDVAIIHRVGTIPVGDNIVLILVSSGHRDGAFRACRFVIDELKRITPIWKRETTPDGEVWVAEHP
ncbi:MAG TPA: MoaD family protein [Nitrospirota bacterium]|nr:MoaD family protein [Nitrospirota bacterium]